MTNDEARNNDEVGITGCHPERSEAQSKDPAELLFDFATGLKAWPRPESFRGCVAASTSLGTTVSLFVISFSLASLRRDHLEFLAENATVAGTHRRSRRSDACADR